MNREYAPYVRLELLAAAAYARGDLEAYAELHAASVQAVKAADVRVAGGLGKEPYNPTPFNYEAWERDRAKNLGDRERD